MTSAEALRQAAAEGLELERSGNAAGYRGVTPNGRGFKADLGASGTIGGKRYLGTYGTVEEAALVFTRARAGALDGEDADEDEEQHRPVAASKRRRVALSTAGDGSQESSSIDPSVADTEPPPTPTNLSREEAAALLLCMPGETWSPARSGAR